ncbi:MAG: hypothetical protein L0177_07485 [Chloroflexi bacterium]|nr:hypothetical protein [Chloroflexota bacterium]
MVMVADAGRLTEFSRLVEGSRSLRGFVQAIGLSGDEEKAVMESLGRLPDAGAPASELPSKSPRLISRDWWV